MASTQGCWSQGQGDQSIQEYPSTGSGAASRLRSGRRGDRTRMAIKGRSPSFGLLR